MGNSVPTQRQLRVGELLRHALATIFSRGETGDPEIESLGITILQVSITPDMRIATAYVRPFKTGDGTRLLAVLERNKKYIRGLLSPHLNMKFTPELRFRLDNSLDYAAHVDELLSDPKVTRDLSKTSEG